METTTKVIARLAAAIVMKEMSDLSHERKLNSHEVGIYWAADKIARNVPTITRSRYNEND